MYLWDILCALSCQLQDSPSLPCFFFFVFGFCFLVCKILKLSANYFELLAELLVTSYLADTLLK